MTEDIYSMTKPGFHEAIRQAKEEAWDAAIASLRYADGSAVEVMSNTNPYRSAS